MTIQKFLTGLFCDQPENSCPASGNDLCRPYLDKNGINKVTGREKRPAFPGKALGQ
jgi:hypothetical protein